MRTETLLNIMIFIILVYLGGIVWIVLASVYVNVSIPENTCNIAIKHAEEVCNNLK